MVHDHLLLCKYLEHNPEAGQQGTPNLLHQMESSISQKLFSNDIAPLDLLTMYAYSLVQLSNHDFAHFYTNYFKQIEL